MTVERMRAFRGLLLRVGTRTEEEFHNTHRNMGRGIISSASSRGRIFKVCHWCKRATTPRKGAKGYWHPLCLRAYYAAMAVTTMADGRSILPKGPCAKCGIEKYTYTITFPETKDWEYPVPPREIEKALEIDHIVALGIAHRRGDRKGLLWAYTLDNLQWLCPDCHRSKTSIDRRIMANLDKGLPEDHVPEPKDPKPATTWRDRIPEGQSELFE